MQKNYYFIYFNGINLTVGRWFLLLFVTVACSCTVVPQNDVPDSTAESFPVPISRPVKIINEKSAENISINFAPKRYLSNRDIWHALRETDAIDESKVSIRLFYSRRLISWANRASGQDQNNVDFWNREHLWPQSKGLKKNLSRMDLYNIVPTDSSINSSRGNKYFDYADCPHSECTECRADIDRWEPPDAVKGDVARVAFYMAAIYNEAALNNINDLRLVSSMPSKRREDFGRLDVLLAWHCADPVSDYERRRNHLIVQYQGNRNPFVDNPGLVENRLGVGCNDLRLQHSAFNISRGTQCESGANSLLNANRAEIGNAGRSTEEYKGPRLRCDDLTDVQALKAYHEGHGYLDADNDGKPCEPYNRRKYESQPSTSPSSKNCHKVKGHYRKGKYVRPHTRCR